MLFLQHMVAFAACRSAFSSIRQRPCLNLVACLWVLSCVKASSQAGQLPAFEVASVKIAAPSNGRVRSSMRGGPGTADASRIIFSNVTLMSVLLKAYDVKPYQATGP